jgi:hypothetical protein
MSGVVTQLGAKGGQDVDTFIDPDMSFWKRTAKRHTQFAMEPVVVDFQGSFDYRRTPVAIFPRQADAYSHIWAVVDLGALDSGNGRARYCEDVGRALFDAIRLDIGAITYDNIYAELEHAMEELNVLKERQTGTTGKSDSWQELVDLAKGPQRLYIRIRLWFTEDYCNVLPMITLHQTDVKLYMTFTSNKSNIITTAEHPLASDPSNLFPDDYTYTVVADDAVIENMFLLVEMVYFDDEERVWFANAGMVPSIPNLRYIITQNQFLGSFPVASGSRQFTLNVNPNHPSKEVIFMFRKQANLDSKDYFNFDGEEVAPYDGHAFASMTLYINGNKRVNGMDPIYLSKIQAAQHHTRVPDKKIYLYSFALFPQESDPSGSLNFSRIDTTKFVFTFSSALSEAYDLLVYIRNQNVATAGNGIMKLAYGS